MKKPVPPSYKWTPANHPELAFMTLEQKACYRTLWDQCITADGLPKDPAELAVAAGYSPTTEFEKAVWSKIKKHFYESSGKLWVGDLEIQRKKDKKFRKSQGIKGKWNRGNGLDCQPPVEPDNNQESTERPNNKFIVKSKQPESNRLETGNDPEMNPAATAQEPREIEIVSEMNQETERQPAVQPLLNPEPPKLNSESVVEAKFNSPGIPGKKIVPCETNINKTPESAQIAETCIENGQNVLEVNFDQEDAWRRIVAAYREDGLFHNIAAKDLFYKVIENKDLFRRLWTAAAKYQQNVQTGAEAVRFMDWFPKWQAKEAPAIMGGK